MTGHSRVLVTGGSGFVGVHCIVQLLGAGYRVRTTVRTLAREAGIRTMLKAGGIESDDALAVVAADLTADAGWADAVAGCDYVLHVASPFPAGGPRNENDLIVPARDGTLRVLRAARDAGVHRVVLTSSFAAIGYGPQRLDRPLTEENWTDPTTPGLSAYVRSKTLAERAAWEFLARDGGALQLVVINPVGVLGPILGTDYSTSIELVQRLMNGALPGVPRLSFGLVDVRDVADLHLRAMTHPAASGERFLAIAEDFVSMQEIARILKVRMGDLAARVPTRVLPNWMVRLAAWVIPSLAPMITELGKKKHATNEKARRVLGWTPRANEEAIVATAESLARFGLLKR